METVFIALIAAAAAVIAPAILAYITGRQRRNEKREDYARQDQVADRVSDAAKQAREAARLLVASNALAADTAAASAAVTNGKLDQIHTLVNSTLTAAIEAQLDATVEQLAMMRRALAGDTTPPSRESMAALEAKIAETRLSLTDRLTQTKAAQRQVEGI